jgi:hypothetical protein
MKTISLFMVGLSVILHALAQENSEKNKRIAEFLQQSL